MRLRARTGTIWVRTGPSNGILSNRQYTFGKKKHGKFLKQMKTLLYGVKGRGGTGRGKRAKETKVGVTGISQ
jgi:hypothetical protein